MVYVSLSVKDIVNTVYFFTKVLRIFDSITNSRLVCNSGIELILDLYEIGSKQHEEIFGICLHAPANLSIHHGEGIKIKILDHLKELGVDHEFSGNIAGEFLHVKDPTGNKIAILAYHGGII